MKSLWDRSVGQCAGSPWRHKCCECAQLMPATVVQLFPRRHRSKNTSTMYSSGDTFTALPKVRAREYIREASYLKHSAHFLGHLMVIPGRISQRDTVKVCCVHRGQDLIIGHLNGVFKG